MKILILCTGNTCRSQMAEGFLKSQNPKLKVFSAGTEPEKRVNPYAVKVMQELDIDISSHKPQDINEFINDSFDWVITVCDDAKEKCPVFVGDVKNKLHIGFEDPAKARGSEVEVLPIYRKVRDQIIDQFSACFTSVKFKTFLKF